MIKIRTLTGDTGPIKCKPLPDDLKPLLTNPIVLCHLGGLVRLVYPSAAQMTLRIPLSRGPLAVLVFSALMGGHSKARPPCGHPSPSATAHVLPFFMFPQVKMSLPATFAQHASSPSTAPGSCCSMRRTHMASASTWSPGRPAPRSRPGSPSRHRSGRRPWRSPHS